MSKKGQTIRKVKPPIILFFNENYNDKEKKNKLHQIKLTYPQTMAVWELLDRMTGGKIEADEDVFCEIEVGTYEIKE